MNDVTHEVRELRSAPVRRLMPEPELTGWPAFFRLVRVYRLMIALICAACVAAAVAYALTATIFWRGETIVTAVRPDAGGGAMSLANDLAGAMGVDLMQQNGEIETANAILTSRNLIAEFVTRNHLIPIISPPGKKPLTLWFAVKHFRDDIITIHNDSKKGVTIISVDWTDPVTASRWANGFVALANELIRNRALEESRRNIAYLNAQLPQTTEVDVKRAMYNLIENETKKAMMANGKIEYAFQTVDPAVPPEVRERPKRTLIVLVALLLGLLLGIGAAFFRDVRRREKLASSHS
jgi:uncharacterized protein involved in exopolysaccharide biosynthesis